MTHQRHQLYMFKFLKKKVIGSHSIKRLYNLLILLKSSTEVRCKYFSQNVFFNKLIVTKDGIKISSLIGKIMYKRKIIFFKKIRIIQRLKNKLIHYK